MNHQKNEFPLYLEIAPALCKLLVTAAERNTTFETRSSIKTTAEGASGEGQSRGLASLSWKD